MAVIRAVPDDSYNFFIFFRLEMEEVSPTRGLTEQQKVDVWHLRFQLSSRVSMVPRRWTLSGTNHYVAYG